MAKRRSRGDGGLYWDETRQRWIAEITVGYKPNGKRITRKRSSKNKTDAREKLKELIRDLDDGLPSGPANYTVADAVNGFLTYGLGGRDEETIKNYRFLANSHIIPNLGKRKLRELSAEDVDRWGLDLAGKVSTRTIRLLYSILSRSVKYAQVRDKVKRNVVILCDIPAGLEGRPSKSLTVDQADALLVAAEDDDSTIGAYIVVSLLAGPRPEEARPLTWLHVDTRGKPDADPPVKPHIHVWHSVRADGDTKTRKSRRTLALPQRAVDALEKQRTRQERQRRLAGDRWQDNGLVFASETGTELDSHNVRRGLRRILRAAGLRPGEWTTRELRHSFVSVLSDSGVSIEDIARLCGHSGTAVTEQVYRHQIRPVMVQGAVAMDEIFRPARQDQPVGHKW